MSNVDFYQVFLPYITSRHNYQYINITFAIVIRPRSTMDSIRVSEAPDSGSIPDEAANFHKSLLL